MTPYLQVTPAIVMFLIAVRLVWRGLGTPKNDAVHRPKKRK